MILQSAFVMQYGKSTEPESRDDVSAVSNKHLIEVARGNSLRSRRCPNVKLFRRLRAFSRYIGGGARIMDVRASRETVRRVKLIESHHLVTAISK